MVLKNPDGTGSAPSYNFNFDIFERVTIRDVNECLEIVKDVLAERLNADPPLTAAERRDINKILNYTSVTTRKQVEKIDEARWLLDDPDPAFGGKKLYSQGKDANGDTVTVVDEKLLEENYIGQSLTASQEHQRSDGVNDANQKYLSADGKQEIIVRRGKDENGNDIVILVDDPELKGTPNYVAATSDLGYLAPVPGTETLIPGTDTPIPGTGTSKFKAHVKLDVNPFILLGVNDPRDSAKDERTAGDRDSLKWQLYNLDDLKEALLLESLELGFETIGGSIRILLYQIPCRPNKPVIDDLQDRFEKAQDTRSPLILDLDGDGVETRGLEDLIFFDHDANGLAENTGWVSKDDGLLVIDLDGDGQIETGQELFGNQFSQDPNVSFDNGFLALASFDENQDGAITAADAQFDDLRVWRDFDYDGVVDDGELQTLSELEIAKLTTAYTDAVGDGLDANGNAHLQLGSFEYTDGTVADMTDVWFARDTSVTIDRDLPEIPDAIAAKANVQGFGNVSSLHAVMAEDTSGLLERALDRYGAAGSDAAREPFLLELLYRWAGVFDIAPDAREATQIYGNAIGDARKLAVLEKFLGYSYLGIWCWGERDPNPHGPAAEILLDAFDELYAYVDGILALQTRFDGLSDTIALTVSEETGYMELQVDEVIIDLRTAYEADAADGQLYALDFANALNSLGTAGEAIAATLRSKGDSNGDGFAQLLASFGLPGSTGTQQNDRLRGTEGDNILLGLGGDDDLEGNAGNDTLIGGEGRDDLSGGAGNDVYRFGLGDGQDTINNFDQDPASRDVLELGAGIAAADLEITRAHYDLLIRISGTTDEIRVSSFFDQYGTSTFAIDAVVFEDGSELTTSDILDAVNAPTSGNDFIITDGSADDIDALAGNDNIASNGGRDTVQGGAGNDRIEGGAGRDSLDGGADQDRINGNEGSDTIIGGSGNDTLSGDAGRDTYVFGLGWGQDWINNYARTYDPVQGAYVYARDYIQFEAGIDASDITARRSGSDLLLTHDQGDSIRISNHFTSEFYQIDEIRFEDGTKWNLATIQTLVQVGSEEADILVGDAGDNTLSGLGGRDAIYGEGGHDSLDGGAEADRIFGGEGDDTLKGGSGNDQLRGDAGTDTYVFDLGFGSDVVTAYDYTGSSDKIAFGAGIATTDIQVLNSFGTLRLVHLPSGDQVSVSSHFINTSYAVSEISFDDGTVWDQAAILSRSQQGTAGNDYLIGDAADNTLEGLAGRDTLRGNEGQDDLDGGADADQIEGGAGNDTLRGGSGNDYLSGNAGDDVYAFGLGFGQDTLYVYDYQGGLDRIVMDAGLEAADFEVRNSFGTLNLVHGPTGDVITVTSHFRSERNAINEVAFSDGTTWDRAMLLAMSQQGSENADYLIGDLGPETIFGLGGNDTIDGGAGDDSLGGGADADRITGGDGDDTLSGGAGNDRVDGGRGADVYTFGLGWGNDTLSNYDYEWDSVARAQVFRPDAIAFEAGIGPGDISVRRNFNDLVLSHEDGDQITVGNHFSSANYEIAEVRFANGTVWSAEDLLRFAQQGSSAGDRLVGNAGPDTLMGLAGNDTIIGQEGDDSLNGGGDNDRIEGAAGEDTLKGGDGNDWLTGGLGEDRYIFGSGWGDDTIQNYDYEYDYTLGAILSTRDVIKFSGGIAPDDISVRRVFNDLHLTHRDGDEIEIDNHFSGLAYEINAVQFADGTVWTQSDLADLTQVGTDGPDRLIGDADPDALSGFNGNDTIDGAAGDDRLRGGKDDDRISGSEGHDTLYGGSGNDSLEGGNGADRYVFGAAWGDDTISNYDYEYDYATRTVILRPDIIAFGSDISPEDIIVRRNFSDLILQHVDGDRILARSHFNNPNNEIAGIEFADGTIWAPEDLLRLSQLGSDLADNLIGDAGDNAMSGQSGNDTITGGDGADKLNGGSDNDFLTGDAGDDTLQGGSGDDTLTGSNGSDVYVFAAGWGADYISNYDREYDFELRQYVQRPDVLQFKAGVRPVDITQSQFGFDLILTHTNGDSIRINNHFRGVDYQIDTLRFASATFAIAEFQAGWDRYFGDETGNLFTSTDWPAWIEGLGGADTLTGSAWGDNIFGGDDNDRIGAGSGDDWARGDAGKDTIDGGDGDDTLEGGEANDRLEGGRGADSVEGGAGRDRLAGDAGNDTLKGGEGNDNLDGGGGKDRLEGDDGKDRLKGNGGNDSLYGGAQNDRLDGGSGRDLLMGDGGKDRLDGGSGNDVLEGGSSNDVLEGGAGNDTLTGGSGRDQFVFALGHDTDVITDFNVKKDSLQLTLGLTDGETDPAEILALFGSQETNGVLLNFGGGDRILLQDLTLNGLTLDIDIA